MFITDHRLFARLPFGIGRQIGSFLHDGSLRSKTLRGSVWTFAAFGAGQVLRLGSNLVLTRVLFPEAFGLMALVNVILQGLQMLSEIGISSSIIQNQDGADHDFLRTAWTLQVIRGLLLWTGACLLTWPVATFYQEPQLWRMIPVASLTVLILGFQTTSLPLYSREMKLKAVSLFQFFSQLLTIGLTIWLAFELRSVWALVWGSVLGSVAQVALGHWMLPGISHRFFVDRAHLQSIVRFGRWLLVSSGLGWLGSRIDQLLLPRLLDFESLGIVSIAFALAALLDQLFARGISGVLFPAISAAGRCDRQAISRAFAKARAALIPALQFAFLALSFGSPILFDVFYPDRYSDARWVSQLLLVGAWFHTMSRMVNSALLADGISRAGGIKALVHVMVATPACCAGAYLYGLPGLLIGAAMSAAIGYFVMLAFALRFGLAEPRQDVMALLAFALSCIVVAMVSHQNSPLGTLQGGGIPAIAVSVLTTGLVGSFAARAILRGKRSVGGKEA